MIDTKPYEDKLYELQKIMEWLINGYGTNCILKFGLAKGITAEWIVKNYNIERSYFRK